MLFILPIPSNVQLATEERRDDLMVDLLVAYLATSNVGSRLTSTCQPSPTEACLSLQQMVDAIRGTESIYRQGSLRAEHVLQ